MATNQLILQLIHGRSKPDADMKDWGFDAKPIHGVSFFRGSYLTTLSVGFLNQKAMRLAQHQTGWPETDDLILEVPLNDDLIRCNDGFYGDFELYVLPA